MSTGEAVIGAGVVLPFLLTIPECIVNLRVDQVESFGVYMQYQKELGYYPGGLVCSGRR
jgi:hypothetical protein